MVLSSAQQEIIRNHVEAIGSSPVFGTSLRRAQLLRYLVERSLTGDASQISEYAIGVDVLGRPRTFDPRTESIVRTEITRLRQKLRDYYGVAKAAGNTSPVVIELPLRSYVPTFVFRESQPEPEVTPVETAAPRMGLLFWRSARWVAASVALCGVIGAIWSVGGRLWLARQAFPRTTNNPQAHELYLKASSTGARATPEAYRKAIALFHDALQKDPNYAAAYLSVAKDEQGLILLMTESPRQGITEMEAALRKALDVAPDLSEARGLLAELRSIRDWDWETAEREYRLALERGAPAFVHMMYGWDLATRGRFAEAHAQLRLAQDLEPVSLDPRFFEAIVYYIEGRFAEAKNLLRPILDLNADYLPGHGLWAMLATLEGNCEEAAPHVEWFARKSDMPITKVVLGWESACRGERAKAEDYFSEAAQATGPAGYASPYTIADGYAMLHDKDEVLHMLERSAADHEPQILYLKVAPEFTEERSDPRYVALERRVGLEP